MREQMIKGEGIWWKGGSFPFTTAWISPLMDLTHYTAESAMTGPARLTGCHTVVLNLLQIAAYEREIGKLREELLKEISHLEERKDEAVKAAANCSAEHFQNLQDQFFSELKLVNPLMIFVSAREQESFWLSGLQKRLTALPPTLRSMKTDYASLRSQVRNFSEFYGSAINEAKKQVGSLSALYSFNDSWTHRVLLKSLFLSFGRFQQLLVRCLKPTKTSWKNIGRRLHCAGSTMSS